MTGSHLGIMPSMLDSKNNTLSGLPICKGGLDLSKAPSTVFAKITPSPVPSRVKDPSTTTPPPASVSCMTLAPQPTTIRPVSSPPLTRSRYSTMITLPYNLVLTAIHTLLMAQVEDLDFVQLLRLCEVLVEIRDSPHRSPFIDWERMKRDEGFEEEVWVEKVLLSVAVVEGVLTGKWDEPVEMGKVLLDSRRSAGVGRRGEDMK